MKRFAYTFLDEYRKRIDQGYWVTFQIENLYK